MDKSKRYFCLVYASVKNPAGKVLIWGEGKTAPEICALHDIPFGKIYSTGTIVYNKEKKHWQVRDLNPLFNGSYRLLEDEKLVLKKINQMTRANMLDQTNVLKKQR